MCPFFSRGLSFFRSPPLFSFDVVLEQHVPPLLVALCVKLLKEFGVDVFLLHHKERGGKEEQEVYAIITERVCVRVPFARTPSSTLSRSLKVGESKQVKRDYLKGPWQSVKEMGKTRKFLSQRVQQCVVQ